MSTVQDQRCLWMDVAVRERSRLRSVHAYGFDDGLNDADGDVDLSAHVAFALELTGAQHAAVSIVDDAQVTILASCPPAPSPRVDRPQSICARMLYASGAGDVFVTADASVDPDLWDHPWVCGASGDVRFYAGAALIGREGLPLGMLCVWSTEPLSFHDAERAGQRLLPIRDGVVEILERRRAAREARLGGLHESVGSPGTGCSAAAAVRAAPSIDTIIDDGTVRTLFQPIVDLADGSVIGFEALTRGPAGTDLESPLALLEAARSVGRLGELDWLCRTNAMRLAADSGLAPTLSWFINVEPAGLEIDCPADLRGVLDHARTHLRVVLEVVERAVEGHVTRLLHATDQARRDAWGVALDDVGAEAGSLALLPFLQPDVVKLDMSLLRETPSATAADITAAVRTYAERTGAAILAEGIETHEQEELAKIFGATYGQGYLYGRPAPLPTTVSAPTRPIPLRQKPAPIQGATPFEILQQKFRCQRGRPEHLRHIFAHLHRYCVHTDQGAVMLTLFEHQAGYLDHQALFDALADRNALTVCLVPDITPRHTDPRYFVGPLPPGSRLTHETAMIVITPHYAGAIATRETEHTAADGTPLVDFVYTHDRRTIIAAARAYLDHMKPGTITYPANNDNRRTEPTRRMRLTTYLTDRLHPAPHPRPGVNNQRPASPRRPVRAPRIPSNELG